MTTKKPRKRKLQKNEFYGSKTDTIPLGASAAKGCGGRFCVPRLLFRWDVVEGRNSGAVKMAIVKEIPVTDPVCGKNTVALDEHAVRRMKERKITEAQVMKKHEFLPKLDISVDEKTGQIRAAYLQIREGTVHKTREISAGNAFADYDRSGWLLGIELLGPCEATVLDKLAKNEPKRIKRFLLGSPPRELVTT